MQIFKQKVVSTIQPIFAGLQTPEVVVVVASAILSVTSIFLTY